MLQVSIKSIVIMSPSVGIRRHSWRLLGKIEVSSHSQFQFNRHHQRLKHDNKIVIKVFKTSPCVLSTEDAASWMTVTKEVCKLWTLSNCYTFFDMSKKSLADIVNLTRTNVRTSTWISLLCIWTSGYGLGYPPSGRIPWLGFPKPIKPNYAMGICNWAQFMLV